MRTFSASWCENQNRAADWADRHRHGITRDHRDIPLFRQSLMKVPFGPSSPPHVMYQPTLRAGSNQLSPTPALDRTPVHPGTADTRAQRVGAPHLRHSLGTDPGTRFAARNATSGILRRTSLALENGKVIIIVECSFERGEPRQHARHRPPQAK